MTGWVVVDGEGLGRERAGEVTRFTEWGAQFGVAVLSNESRDLGVLAITTKAATRYVPVRVTSDDDRAVADALFVRPAALTDVDVRHVTRDDAGALSAEGLADAPRGAIRVRGDPSALDRIVLSDPRGALVVLEGDELRAGDRVIDLSRPSSGARSSLRGGDRHRSLGDSGHVGPAGGSRGRARRRRRVRATRPRGARVPRTSTRRPHIELRMAIERLFMAPLRHALDRAPRVSRAPAPIAKASPRAPT